MHILEQKEKYERDGMGEEGKKRDTLLSGT